MAEGDGSPLLQLRSSRTLPRRKRRPNFPPPPKREPPRHAAVLRAGLDNVRSHLDAAAQRHPGLATDVPYVRIDMAAGAIVFDRDLERIGLIPVLWREDHVLAAYSSERDLRTLSSKLTTYAQERAALPTFAKIEHLQPWTRADRTSEALRAQTLDPAALYVVDVVLLPLADEKPNHAALPAIEEFVTKRRGRILDRSLGATFTAFRTRMKGQALDELLDYRDDVAWVDFPPRPVVGVPVRHSLTLNDLPDVVPPQPTAPAICVVDSGILEGHPLLEPAVMSELSKSFPATVGPPVPAHPDGDAGHGTRVAGIATYADVSECVRLKSFLPDTWIVNARVLDDNAKLDEERMPFMREIVAHVGKRCRVFNLSFGSPRGNDHLTMWGAELDELTRTANSLFVVSSGNHVPRKQPTKAYPAFMDDADWRVLAPAESLNALAVGGIATDGGPHPAHAYRKAVGEKHAPSPFSRHGGLKDVVKPELVEIAGTAAVDDDGPWIMNDAGLGVPTTSPNFARGVLVGSAIGTSFAAPKVAHLAAKVIARYPDATPNLIRALLVQSAAPPEPVRDWPPEQIMRLCGFGVPDADRALVCRPRRATLFAESRVAVDEVRLFDVPVPDDFARAKGKKRIVVTIAFDPPVSLTHRDRPAGIQLTWGLVRGDKSDEDVRAAISAVAESEVSGAAATLRPKASDIFMPASQTKLRKAPQRRGTVQKNVFEWSRGAYGDRYQIAVTAKANRPRHANDTQRFAVVVTLERDDDAVNVYTLVRARLDAGRVRVRVPGT